MTLVVLVLLALWMLVSLANQVRGPWTRFLGLLNAFALLPRLDFFAPDPIDVDYHLVFRDFSTDGAAGPWQRIHMNLNGPLRLMWSPAKRDLQAMMAAVGAIAQLQQVVAPLLRDPEAIMQISLPYLFLLHRALQAPRSPGATERQFMVVETTGFGQSRGMALGILSNPHRLD